MRDCLAVDDLRIVFSVEVLESSDLRITRTQIEIPCTLVVASRGRFDVDTPAAPVCDRALRPHEEFTTDAEALMIGTYDDPIKIVARLRQWYRAPSRITDQVVRYRKYEVVSARRPARQAFFEHLERNIALVCRKLRRRGNQSPQPINVG